MTMRLLGLPLLLCGIAAAAGTSARAGAPLSPAPPPPPPPASADSRLAVTVRLSDDALRRFDTAFSALAAQAKVAVVAEASPLHPVLADPDLASLRKALPAGGAPLGKALPAIAAAYDYDASRLSDGTVVLTKRYSDPKDFPFVPLAEAQRDLTALLRAADPGYDGTPRLAGIANIQTLVDSLSDADIARVAEGIPASQLAPQQARLLWRYTFDLGTDGVAGRLEQLADILKAAGRDRSVFRRFALLGIDEIPVFGFEERLGDRMQPFVLSHGLAFGVGGMSRSQTIGGASLSIPEIQTDSVADPAVRDRWRATLLAGLKDDYPPGASESATPAPPLPCTITLGELEKRLRARMTGGTAAVDPVLATKPVSVFGIDALSGDAVLDAAAAVYGLRVLHQTGGRALLTLRAPRPAETAAEFRLVSAEMVPAPWQRAAAGGARRAQAAAAASADGEKPAKYAWGAVTYLEDFRREAVHRLRVLTEPKAAAAPDGRYPMARMTDEEGRLFALLFLADVVYSNHAPAVEWPSAMRLSDIGKGRVKLVWSKDGRKVSFGFGKQQDATSGVVIQGGGLMSGDVFWANVPAHGTNRPGAGTAVAPPAGP